MKIPSHLQFYVQFTDQEKQWRPTADLKAERPLKTHVSNKTTLLALPASLDHRR
jgi:hypothetical protein